MYSFEDIIRLILSCWLVGVSCIVAHELGHALVHLFITRVKAIIYIDARSFLFAYTVGVQSNDRSLSIRIGVNHTHPFDLVSVDKLPRYIIVAFMLSGVIVGEVWLILLSWLIPDARYIQIGVTIFHYGNLSNWIPYHKMTDGSMIECLGYKISPRQRWLCQLGTWLWAMIGFCHTIALLL